MRTEDARGEVLARVADAVADGTPIDWDRELTDHPELRPAFRGLEDVEKVAGVLREATPVLGDPSEGEPAEDVDAPEEESLGAWGRLLVQKRLAEGACAEIFEAFDPQLKRSVALKIPKLRDDEHKKCFIKEARRLARVQHVNVLPVHGVEENDGKVGMWTDLLEGQTLEERLKEQGRFGADEAALVGVALCKALAAIHKEDLLHRDIKTANVMRVEGGRIVLMDFSSAVNRVGEGGLLGDSYTQWTPKYRAPEIMQGQPPTRASDIYTLGVLLYRLVTNKYPVKGSTDDDSVTPLLDHRPDLDPRFAHVIERALEWNPSARFSSAGEMEQALDPLLNFQPVVETPPQPVQPVRSRRVWSAIATVVAIAMAVALGWGLLSPAPFAIEADLFRRGVSLDERLTSGAQLSLDDELFLEVEATRPIYAYVLNEDMAESRFVLFPLPGLDLQNPLAPGVKHRIPGSTTLGEDGSAEQVEKFWVVSSTGGEETLILIASAEPLPELEDKLSTVPRAGSAQTIELDTSHSEEGLRGIGGVTHQTESSEPGENEGLSELSEQLLANQSDDLRVWQIRLRNPGGGGG